jgi:hypothetical protein
LSFTDVFVTVQPSTSRALIAIPAPTQRNSVLCIGAEGHPARAGVTPVYAPDGAGANGSA